MVRWLVIEGKRYVEVPDDIKGKALLLKVEDGFYILISEHLASRILGEKVKISMNVRQDRSTNKNVNTYRGKVNQYEKGYWVLESEPEALEFSKRFSQQLSSGEIIGVKSFDGKYYAVRRDVYNKLIPLITRFLSDGGKTVEELSTFLKADKELIKAVLEVAREEGVVIERSGGMYELLG